MELVAKPLWFVSVPILHTIIWDVLFHDDIVFRSCYSFNYAANIELKLLISIHSSPYIHSTYFVERNHYSFLRRCMSQIVLYFLHSTLVLSFYIFDVFLPFSILWGRCYLIWYLIWYILFTHTLMQTESNILTKYVWWKTLLWVHPIYFYFQTYFFIYHTPPVVRGTVVYQWPSNYLAQCHIYLHDTIELDLGKRWRFKGCMLP